MATKNYVDYTGLEYFLGILKEKYAANSATEFKVNYATNADAAVRASGDKDSIQNTYLSITNAAGTYVPLTRTIADVELGNDITKESLLTALNVADGAQVNVLEKVSVKDASGTSALTITDKGVVVDLSSYATKTDITKTLSFKGVKDYEKDLPSEGMAVGDVWLVKYRGESGTGELNAEFVYVDAPAAHWEQFGSAMDLSGYVTKETYNADMATKASIASVEAIYKAEADGSASGVLITKINEEKARIDGIVGTPETGKTIQAEIDAAEARLDIIEGEGDGSVKKALADAKSFTSTELGKLSLTKIDGPFIATIEQANGIVTATAGTFGAVGGANETQPVNGKAVADYVTSTVNTAVGDLNLAEQGGAGKFVQSVSQANGKVSATAVAIATDLAATGLDNNAPAGALAAKTYADSCKVMTAETGGEQITVMAPLPNTEIDKMFGAATV